GGRGLRAASSASSPSHRIELYRSPEEPHAGGILRRARDNGDVIGASVVIGGHPRGDLVGAAEGPDLLEELAWDRSREFDARRPRSGALDELPEPEPGEQLPVPRSTEIHRELSRQL